MFKMSGQPRIMTHDEELEVTRHGQRPGQDLVYVDGKLTVRCEYRFSVQCNVQPIGGKDLLLVPEADRFEESIWVYQADPYSCEADHALQAGDIIARCGKSWQVQSSEDWGSYVKARATAVDVGPESHGWANSCDDDAAGDSLLES